MALIAAFNRRAGNLTEELSEAVETWVKYFMQLKPIDISKLQRIAQVQERMLVKLARTAKVDSPKTPRRQHRLTRHHRLSVGMQVYEYCAVSRFRAVGKRFHCVAHDLR